jgi:hypothetical protein
MRHIKSDVFDTNDKLPLHVAKVLEILLIKLITFMSLLCVILFQKNLTSQQTCY